MMRRDFEVMLREADGEPEVFGRMFPLNTRQHILELLDDGKPDEYDEEFLPGCTTRIRQVQADRGGTAKWIAYTIEHGQTLDHRLGYCYRIEETETDVFGTFRFHPHMRERGISMVSTSHGGMSIEFIDRGKELTGPLRQHRSIHIDACTATPIPTYATAGVLSIREDLDPLNIGTPNLDRVREILGTIPVPTLDEPADV